MRGGKTLLLAQLAAAALTIVAAACVKPDVLRADLPGAASTALPDRTECEQIYGTAYRSHEERDWFEANCTTWPFFSAPDGPAPSAQDQLCQSLSGRPYASVQEQQSYLTTCLGQALNPNQAGPAQAPRAPAAAIGPDRTNCNEIRGTAYRSDTERSWYLRSCFPTPAAVPATPKPPVSIFPQGPLLGPGLPRLQPPQLPVTPGRGPGDVTTR